METDVPHGLVVLGVVLLDSDSIGAFLVENDGRVDDNEPFVATWGQARRTQGCRQVVLSEVSTSEIQVRLT